MEVASVHKYLRPASAYGWSDADAEVWAAMVKERDAGCTRLLGVSPTSAFSMFFGHFLGSSEPGRLYFAWSGASKTPIIVTNR